MKKPEEETQRIVSETFIDLTDGRIISRGAPGWLHEAVAGALTKAVREPAEQLVGKLLALLDGDDHRAAAALVVNSLETGIADAPNAALLAQLRRISVDRLGPPEAAAFLRVRTGLAAIAGDYVMAGADAETLLASPHMEPADKAHLKLTVAMAALRRGGAESAFAMFREIAESEESDPRSRAWAYRNMSLGVPVKDGRCEQYSRRSSDFFLMSGDKLQAAGSLVRAMLSCLAHRPSAAAEILNEPIEWFAGEGAQEQYVRGGILQNRARAAWMLKQHKQAFKDAVESARLLRGLSGAERELVGSLLLAIDAGSRIGAPVDALTQERDALLKSEQGGEQAIRNDLVAQLLTFDIEAVKKARASQEVQRRPVLRAIVAIAEAKTNTLSHLECLQRLDAALQDAREGGDDGIVTAVVHAIGDELLKSGDLEGALAKYREVIQRDPLNVEARQNLAFILQELNRHEEGVRLIEDQLKLWGPLPGLTFVLGRFLLDAGHVDRATTIFARLAIAAETPANVRTGAALWRDKAVAAGGRIQSDPTPQSVTYTRADLEKELTRFAETIKREKRMTFWRKGDTAGHKWIEKPESRAKDLLHVFLSGAFRKGLKQFEEIASGAGRIDLYVELAGGVSAILELKMLGAPYSTSYALQGEDQIAHYMDNRDCHLGYLVVFDARTVTWGSLPDEGTGNNTIVRVFVDVRPDIPSKAKKDRKPKKRAGR